MKQHFIFLVLFIPILCMAQSSLTRVYEYDAAGNRTSRKTLEVFHSPPAPPSPAHLLTQEPLVAEYFIETIAQVEIKIYPNPATEKVTLEISGWETLQTGNFKLYSLSGQLLQEHPIHSASTIISLKTLPTGVYILKVNINDRTEDWKIIKN